MKGTTLLILTTMDKLFFENKDMSSDEFQKAFHVHQAEGQASKVLLGFKLHTTIKLLDLKRRLLHMYLIPHQLLLQEHSGGIENSIESYAYRFLKADHPDHPDNYVLNHRFACLVSEAWKTLPWDDRTKWQQGLPNLFFWHKRYHDPNDIHKGKSHSFWQRQR